MRIEPIATKNILVIHGPNLNLLGTREPEIYGNMTLDEINRTLLKIATDAGAKLVSFQSNSETELISRIHQAIEDKTTTTAILHS